MTAVTAPSTPEYLAALDIGSNSFHFVLARLVDQHLQILHSEKYRVQLAQGLDQQNCLSKDAIKRGVETLEKLATSTQQITQGNFRAVATFTLRQATNASEFLKEAAKVFPFDIEIISGHEEARLIYQGVAFHRQHNEQTLVIDIGGGSTECIIGQCHDVKRLDSLNIGCVSYQKLFFPDGAISRKRFDQAIRSASHQVDSIIKRFKKCGWQQAIGTSGTIKAIANIINADKEVPHPITLKDVKSLRKQLQSYNHCDDIDLPGLKDSRKAVICSGVAVLLAVMECLEIDALDYCQYALREGVLFEQLESLRDNDVKQRTVNSFTSRFNIDLNQAEVVKTLALEIYQQVAEIWKINTVQYKTLLKFSCDLHELGVDINASGYQKHGQYIIEQADMAGFNREQQRALAWLVGNQRKKITPFDANLCYALSAKKLYKLCIILRLSVILNQQRHQGEHYFISVSNDRNSLSLTLDSQWLLERPIIDTELYYEQQVLEKIGYQLIIES